MPSRDIRRATQSRGRRDQDRLEKKRTAHPFLYAGSVLVLLVIVVTFIGGPAIARSGPGGRIVFGSYKGKPIEYFPGNYFSQQKDLAAEQLRQGGENQNVEVQAYKVWRTAFDQTILHTAILLEAERSGLWVSSERVDQALLSSGPYVVNGQFSEARYKATSPSERMTTRQLVRGEIIQEQYLRDSFLHQQASPQEGEFFKKMFAQQRKFSFVRFSFSDYPQSEVAAYARDNRDKFRRMKLSRILVKSSEREAQEIHKKLVEGGSFEELARAHSKGLYAEKGGDMGWRYFYDLEADFEGPQPVEQVFALGEGELSPVLKSRFGWVIFRADSQPVELDTSDPEALKVVRDYLMKYEKGKVEDYFQARAESFVKRVRETSFTLAGVELGQPTYQTDFFPVNYQGVYVLDPVRSLDQNVSLASAAYSQEFFVQAFSLAPGQVSEPVLLDDQVVVLSLADTRTAPRQELDLMDRFHEYFVNQSRQQDLQTALLNPDYIVDDFNQTFYQSIFPRQQPQQQAQPPAQPQPQPQETPLPTPVEPQPQPQQ